MVLEQGEIIERGDHDDLLSQGGKYYQLYTGQAELSSCRSPWLRLPPSSVIQVS